MTEPEVTSTMRMWGLVAFWCCPADKAADMRPSIEAAYIAMNLARSGDGAKAEEFCRGQLDGADCTK